MYVKCIYMFYMYFLIKIYLTHSIFVHFKFYYILCTNALDHYCAAAIETKPAQISVCVLSCGQLFATPWTVAHQIPPSMNFPGKDTGVGGHAFL